MGRAAWPAEEAHAEEHRGLPDEHGEGQVQEGAQHREGTRGAAGALERPVVAKGKIQAALGLRNRTFRLRVWTFDGQFGAILDHVGGSPEAQSRGASPPDPSRNL